MNCYLCTKPISKSNNSGLCTKCKIDPKLTIPKSSAKQQYVLTEDEIKTATDEKKIRFFTYSGKGSTLILSDVEKYAKQVFEPLPSTDKRKKLYEKHMVNLEKKKEIDNYIAQNMNPNFPDLDTDDYNIYLKSDMQLEEFMDKMREKYDKN